MLKSELETAAKGGARQMRAAFTSIFSPADSVKGRLTDAGRDFGVAQRWAREDSNDGFRLFAEQLVVSKLRMHDESKFATTIATGMSPDGTDRLEVTLIVTSPTDAPDPAFYWAVNEVDPSWSSLSPVEPAHEVAVDEDIKRHV